MSSYYVALNGQQAGPFPLPEIQSLIQTGRANASDLCWQDGMADWKPLGSVLPSLLTPAAVAAAPAFSPSSFDVKSEPVFTNPYAAPQTALPAHVPGVLSRRYGGLGRLAYFGLTIVAQIAIASAGTILTAATEMPQIILLSFAVQVIAGLILCGQRLKNIGMNPWLSLVGLIPFVNLIIAFRCIACQEGYVETKRLDTAGKVIAWIFGLIVLLGVAGAILGQ